MSDATDEIRASVERMVDAYVDRDLETFQSFFTEDIVAMPPGAPPIEGGSMWNRMLEGIFGRSTIAEMSTESKETTVIGDVAFEWYLEATTSVRKDTGESNRNYYKGMWVLRRGIDGVWRVSRWVWNETSEFEPNADKAIQRSA